MKKLLLGLASVLLIAAAPTYDGYVNDFADIIPDDREVTLEKSLHDYEAKTSIEIAVVTTPSLDGRAIEDYSIELARDWGVGKAGADNGILVLIAPNEHQYRIEVGYGLEADLTDADSSIIARDTLVGAFRAGDLAGGIENLTQALTSHLGSMTPEQRALFHQKMQDAEKRRQQAQKAAFMAFLGGVFVLLVFGALFALLFYGVRAFLRKRRIRMQKKKRCEDLLAYAHATESEPRRIMAEVAAINLPNLPAWMQDDKERYVVELEASLEHADHIRTNMLGMIESDLDSAEALKPELVSSLEDAEKYLKQLCSIPEQVQAFRDECEEVVGTVSAEIDDLVKHIGALTRKKYRVTDLVPGLDVERLVQEKQSITTLLSNRGEGPLDASESIHNKAKRLQKKVASLRQTLDSSIGMQSSSKRRIAVLKKRIEAFPTLLHEHTARVERLQSLAPRHCWISFSEGLLVFERTLGGIAPRTDAAIRANSMDVQLFADAAKTLDLTEANLHTVDATLGEAATLESAIVRTKQGFNAKRSTLEKKMSRAQRLMTDSDVGSAAKSRLAEAQRILEGIRAGTPGTDWIAVDELLEQSSAKVIQATNLATSDIDSKERERRRKRDAEERRQRRAEESANYSSSYSSFGSSSSGGFGGGSFGGGGASGGW